MTVNLEETLTIRVIGNVGKREVYYEAKTKKTDELYHTNYVNSTSKTSNMTT